MTIPPQTFEQTEAFQIIQDGGIKVKFFACYARAITKIAALFPLYNYFEVDEGINNKNLIINLKHRLAYEKSFCHYPLPE